MGKLTLSDLIIYILRLVWFIADLLLDLLVYVLDVTYGELWSLKLSTQIIIYFLLMGIVLMSICPFHSTIDPQLYPGPIELDFHQVFKPTEAKDDWNKMHHEQIEKKNHERKKEVMHFLVRFSSDAPGVKSIEADETKLKKETTKNSTFHDSGIMEKSSRDSLPRLHVKDQIEEIENELLTVEPNEEY